MSITVRHKAINHAVRNAARLCLSRLPALALGMLIGTLHSIPVYAGGADVSADEILSDNVTLTTFDGLPLDIDGDGFVDLVVAANRGNPAGRSRYYLGNGDGTFRDGERLTQGASSFFEAADMNGDTFIDLVQARRDLTELLYPADGVGGFNVPIEVSIDTTRTLELAIGDLDNDGDLDIVTANGHAGGVPANPLQSNRFYLNNGTATFVGADISADADDSRTIVLVDIDGDGDLDVIVGNDHTTPNSNRIYLNQFVESGNLTVSFAGGIDFGLANDQTAKILIGDLDNNGQPDIVALNQVSSPESPGINRFSLNESAGGILQLSAVMDVSADTDETTSGVLADFDGDGDLDLVVANLLASGVGQSSRTRLYLNQFIESGSTAVSFSDGIDISPDEQMSRSIAAADLNGDGHIDLVVGNQDGIVDVSGRDRRYLNSGNPADPFGNIVPVIDAQAGALETDEEADLEILLADVEVTDDDNIFPDDFTLTVQEGTNYTVIDNTITPDVGFAGDLTVPVIVNDGTDDSDPFDLTVTVNDTINNLPEFTSTPVEDAAEDVAYTYNITATDLDVGTTLAITAPTLPGWLTLTDNGDGTAVLTGTPDAGDAGANNVSLQASDGTATTAQDFVITVGAANNPPTFSSTPVENAEEDVAYSYNIVAADADAGDTLTITAPTMPGWLALNDNGDGTATLAGTPAAGDVGDHAVSLQVTDGTDTAAQDFTVTVAAAPPPPPVNEPPTFTSTAVTEGTEGTAYSYDVTASDADGDDLEITAPTLPSWLTLTDNGDGTATLEGTPGASHVGGNDVSLQVSDGTDTATQSFTVSVAAAPAPPPPPPPPPPRSSGGGGSTGFLSLLGLLAFAAVGRRRSWKFR